MTNKKKEKSELSAVTLLANLVLEFGSGVLIGILIGWGLDKLLNTKPIFIIIFLCFGFAAGFINIYRYVKKRL